MPGRKRRKLVTPYFSPDRGAADQIVGFIQRVRFTLDIAIYSFTHDKIADAVIDAVKRGVRVRALMDRLQASSRYADDERIEEAGVEVRRHRGGGAMHHKFCIGDAEDKKLGAVITGSFNWSARADEKNYENFVIIRTRRECRRFLEEFERLWEMHSPA